MSKSSNPFVRAWYWWFTPRSSDPTVRYRERALRVLLPVIILLRSFGTVHNYSGAPDVLTPYAPLWINLAFFVIPIFFSFYFLARKRVGWAGACFLLHWYLIDLLSLPAEGYWYPGFQISLIMQVILGVLLLPSRAILPFMGFQLLTVGLWGDWLDVHYYDPPLLASGQPVAIFRITILTLAAQEAIIVFIVRYLRFEMEKSLGLQKASIQQLQAEMAERQQAELALQRSETMYRRAIDAAGAVPYIIRYEAHTFSYLFLGENILHMTGYSAAEMTAGIWNALIQEGFPRGKLAHLTYAEADRLTDEDHSLLWECDFRIRTRDGQTRWIADTSVKGFDEKNENLIAIGIYLDITERKLAEELTNKVNFELQRRLKELYVLNAVAQAGASAKSEDEMLELVVETLFRSLYSDIVAVGLWDEQTGVLRTHPSAHRGLPARIQYMKSSLGDGVVGRVAKTRVPYRVKDTGDPLYQPIDPAIRSELCVPILAGEKLVGVLDVESKRPDAFSDADENLLFTIAGQLASALERLRAEQQLRNLNTELEQRVVERTRQIEAANQELEAFSYSVSHDLRAPLRAINGFTRIIKEDFSAGMELQALDFLDKVIASGVQMNLLIAGLLAFSRTSRKELNKQTVDLRPVVQAVIEALAPETAGRQIKWVLGDLPSAQADPTLIQQVFANLIGNAVKYTGKRPQAQIEVGSCLQADETVYFVRDNGAGFDMQYGDKLFGVFQRLHRDEEFEGTGIGLAIVQRIIERHGGRIWAEAEPEKGATFYFTLA